MDYIVSFIVHTSQWPPSGSRAGLQLFTLATTQTEKDLQTVFFLQGLDGRESDRHDIGVLGGLA